MTGNKKDTVGAENGADASDSRMASRRRQDVTDGGSHEYEASAQLDRCFDAQLTQMYSEVVSEPLPRAFLDLLERLREKTNAR